jgi:hypothetical protein
MAEPETGKAVQLLDLMLDHFADDEHWTRGRYDDGAGGHCLVGALLHLAASIACHRRRRSRSCTMRCPAPGFRSCTSRGHSVGCYLNNAKVERSRNAGFKRRFVFGSG